MRRQTNDKTKYKQKEQSQNMFDSKSLLKLNQQIAFRRLINIQTAMMQ